MDDQIDGQEWVLLGKSDLADAKSFQLRMQERGIALSLLNNPETCSSKSCKPSVEVYAHPGDLPVIAEFLNEQRNRLFDGLSVDASLLEEVFDPERETARCPACGTTFSTKSTECPDCGLAFA